MLRNYRRLQVRIILTFNRQNGSCLEEAEVVSKAVVTSWAIQIWWRESSIQAVDVGSSKLWLRALEDPTRVIGNWKWCKRPSVSTFHIEDRNTSKTKTRCLICSNTRTLLSRSRIAPIKKDLTRKIRYKKSWWICGIHLHQYNKRVLKRQH